MKSILDPSSSVIILFVSMALLMFSINTPTCLCDDHDFGQYYTNCNAGFSCEGSSISDHLKYPFWGENRHSYCGSVSASSYSHDMELTCESHVPKITLNEVKYRVLNWDNTTQMLRVGRDDYWGGNVCAVTDYYKNSTFDNTPFQLVGDDHNGYMNLLYNCDAKGNLSTDQFDHMTCRDVYGSGNYTTVVYTVEDPSSVPCSPSAIVVIPIIKQPPALVPQSRLADALEGGFELRYTGRHFAECGRCVASGGACGNGFKFGTDDFTCFFCKDDGPYTTHNTTKCNSQSSKWIRKRELWLIMTGVLFVGFGVAIFIIVIVMKRGICGKKRIFWVQGKLFDHDVKAFMQSYDLFMVKRYNYAELKKITNSFRDKVGQGGYGVVYKGCLPDGRRVAAKVISESKGSGEDFINEVASIGRTSHMNIVSLLGFCYEVNKRALIFEFMPNGSLDKFIYRSGFPNAICDFDWNTLFQIAIGIARGLEYLHQGCIARILHLDIKPQNILLDEDFCPKISDFGLAKICQKKESIVSIPGTRGTIGYMAPEVFSRAFGGVSHKSDVYSYGMLILEMIGGRNNHDTGGSHTTDMYFPDWIYKDLEQGKTPANCLAISEEENEIVRKISMVSLWCIQTNPLDRPSMKKVIDLLEGPLQSVPHPPKPILYSPELSPLQISSMSSNSLYEANSITT